MIPFGKELGAFANIYLLKNSIKKSLTSNVVQILTTLIKFFKNFHKINFIAKSMNYN
jgi:hypothetical protein